MRAHYKFSAFEDDVDRNAGRRLALAGGSDQPPPGQDEKSADVIRFPLERARPSGSDRAGPVADDPSAAEAYPAGTGALWAAWLTSVLSSAHVDGLGSER